MITFILTLIIIGQALLFIELAIIPGLGVAGVLGLGAIAGSCYLSFANISTTAGIMIILINIILATIVVMLTLRKKTWKRFSLDTNIDAKIDTPIKEKGVSVGAGIKRPCGMRKDRNAADGMDGIDDILRGVFSVCLFAVQLCRFAFSDGNDMEYSG
ncbi:MAG: hypothetical protein IIU76_05250, partial [Bacteroidales bacterium]|nr:hypothetical protein [Bacteroidales bacterium]